MVSSLRGVPSNLKGWRRVKNVLVTGQGPGLPGSTLTVDMALCKGMKVGEYRGDCREVWKESRRRLDRLIANRLVMRQDITGNASGAFVI